MYYPKSQIKTNLYTNGEEYRVASTKQPYVGYYYEISDGRKFVGKTPSVRVDPLLEPISDTIPKGDSFEALPVDPNVIFLQIVNNIFPNDNNYNNSNYSVLHNTQETRIKPTVIQYLIKEADIKKGNVTRYFCKKNNESIFFETNEDSYKKLKSKSSTIAYDLYTAVSINWQTQQPDNARVNKNLIANVEKQYKWYGFVNSFQNNFG